MKNKKPKKIDNFKTNIIHIHSTYVRIAIAIAHTYINHLAVSAWSACVVSSRWWCIFSLPTPHIQPLSSSHHTDSFATINATNHINHNNNHNKSSPSLDSCIEFSKKSSSKGPSSLGSACDSIGFDSMSYQTKSRGSLSTRSSSSGDLGPPEYDLGPHRELPVDVPDNFVEMAKAPPRYPPPKLHMVKEIVKSKESLSSNGSLEKELIQSQLPSPKPPNRHNEV